MFSRSILVVLLVSLAHFYFYASKYVQELDYKLYDVTTFFFSQFEKEESDAYSVVVDIDEKSIQTFGQWPWPRVLDAELIEMIDLMAPSAIGVNIVFPEKDRASPLSIQQFYEKYFDINIDIDQFPIKLQDNDKLLFEAITHANVTLSVYLQDKFYFLEHCENMSYKKNIFSKVQTKFQGDGLLCNDKSLQEGVENFGFINAWKDSDGIFRRVPLFMHYKEEVLPSFALATLLSFDEELALNKKEDTVLINFLGKRPKIISAADIFTKSIKKSDIQGKVIILGSSVVGLNSSYKIASAKSVSESMIHAVLVDNILNNKLLVQPKIYKMVNILISLALSLLFILFLSQKNYFEMAILLLLLWFSSIVFVVAMYMNGVYVSIGYLLVPFLSILVILIFYHLNVLNKEQHTQEKLFIRQSKLASMGEMISLIAHQWRQPLSAINGTVLNMDIDYRNEKLNAKKFDNYLNDIENTTGYLSKTISDFSDFFSISKEPQVFELLSVIKQAKSLSAMSLSKDVEIIHRKHDKIWINGYSSELVQSLLVLLNNAIHVCQNNLEKTEKGKIFIDITKVDANVLIAVEDNGGGIEKKDMKKIFDPYFTTKEKHNGTGLGLYILKLIVEDSMNGKVYVRNGKEGAIFTLEIPVNME